jgi:hypothetical protein
MLKIIHSECVTRLAFNYYLLFHLCNQRFDKMYYYCIKTIILRKLKWQLYHLLSNLEIIDIVLVHVKKTNVDLSNQYKLCVYTILGNSATLYIVYGVVLWQVNDKLYHIMLYRVYLTWVGFELTTLVVISIDCIGR